MNFNNRRFCFLDIETTGFSPEKDSMIELSFIMTDQSGKELSRFDQVLVPDKSPLNDFVRELTGITEEEIEQKGVVLDEPLRTKIREQIGDAIIVGHNIDFDINFLVGNDVDLRPNGRIDTHELARIILFGEASYALEVLAAKFGFTHENAHRAMSDVEVSIELYWYIVEKINQLEPTVVEKIREFLAKQPQWLAGELLLNSSLTGEYVLPARATKNPPKNLIFDDAKYSQIVDKLNDNKVFVRAGTANKTLDFQKKLADFIPEKSLIVTDRLDYVADYPVVPTPEVILDPARLATFVDRPTLTDPEMMFALQLLVRSELGYRGKRAFDLFFQQDKYWDMVCVRSVDSLVFQSLLAERKEDKVLVLTPLAFWRLAEIELFNNRVLLVDEAEKFAEKLLFSPVDELSLKPYLDSAEESTANGAAFWVSNFCKEVVEPKLGHDVTPFPVKVLLSEHGRFPELVESLADFAGENTEKFADFLTDPREKLVRWATYYPDGGNVVLGSWHPDEWRDQKRILEGFKTVFFYRHTPSQSMTFWRIFAGIDKGEFIEVLELISAKSWEVPTDLVSAKSPDHNEYCAQWIYSLTRDTWDDAQNRAVLFSSLETLRKVWTRLGELDIEKQYVFFGERMMGGAGKLYSKLEVAEKFTVLLQRLDNKKLANFSIKTVVLQKFLFEPPHPLLDKLDSVMKESKLSLWDVWTVPMVSAKLARRVADFPEVERIVCLDGRENAGWGKNLVRMAFPEIFK